MTSTAATNLTTASDARPLITQRGWAWIAVLTVLFMLLHRNFLYRSLLISLDDPDWSHALLVPLIGIYYLFQQRARLVQLNAQVCWWGLPIMLFGMVSYAFWIYPGRNDMFQGYSMIISLFGLVLFILGPRMMMILWFPIFYLGFGVKVSQKLWELVALKLQTTASVSSTFLLNVIGMFLDLEATVRGNTIDIFHHGMKIDPPMNVAEACSGLRMLMAFLALGVAMAFLFPRLWWQRAIMVLMTLPIAVSVNVGRVTTLGILHVYAPEYAKGDFHIFVGMLMLIPAAGLFWLLGWVLDKMVILDDESQADLDKAKSDYKKHTRMVNSFGLSWLIRKVMDDSDDVEEARQVMRGPDGKQILNQNAPTEVQTSTIMKGALFGAAMTFLACLLYVQTVVAVRPDLLVDRIGGSETTVRVVAIVASGVVLFLLWSLSLMIWPRLVPRDGSVSRGRKRGVVLAMSGGFLVTAMVGQVAILEANDVVMFKAEVPLRKSLDRLEHPTGRWKFIKQDPPLNKDVEDELGTKMYVNRTYEDTLWAGNARGRFADVHIAYYTGTVDTVPHVPQQCFKAGGMDQVAGGGTVLHLEGDGYKPDPQREGAYLHAVKDTGFGDEVRIPEVDVHATYFTFANPARNNQRLNVAYFFVANGKFLPSPNAVRANGFDLRDKYSYYCKIQVTVEVPDKDEAMERVSSLLSELMPEIMSCLPDWVDVTEGRWPAEQGPVSKTGNGE